MEVAAGSVGLIGFAGGSLAMGLPPVDASDDEVVATLVHRRTPILTDAVLSVLGVALLLAPLAEVGGRLDLATGAVGALLVVLAGLQVATVAFEVAGTGPALRVERRRVGARVERLRHRRLVRRPAPRRGLAT